MLSDARKRANEKWRKAHRDYHNDWVKNKYHSDPAYRERCIFLSRRRRQIAKDAREMMQIQVEV